MKRDAEAWAALHERLAADAASPARPAADVLAERARLLARPLGGATAGDTVPALLVRAGGAAYAILLADVVEILRADGITPLPGADPVGADLPVVGIVAWRGHVLATLGLGGRRPPGLDPVAAEGAASTGHVVVAGDPRAPVAFVVDALDDVRPLPVASLASSMSGISGASSTTRRAVPTLGVTPDAVTVLDVAALARSLVSSPAAPGDAPPMGPT